MENLQTNLPTVREKEVIAEMSKGLYDREIAGKKIFISTETVKKHLRNIYKKSGVRNRVEASVRYMFDHKNIA